MTMTMREIGLEIGGRPLAPARGGYTVTMREDAGAAAVLRALPAASVHLGWGSFRNLDVAAATQASRVLVCDINLHQLTVWRAVEAALAATDAPAAFVDRLARDLPRTPRPRQFEKSTREWLRADLDRAESWLATRARFDHIRALFGRGAVGIACLDVRGGFDLLARRLPGGADILYLSNLPYMMRQPRGFFGEPHAGDAPLQAMWRNLRRIARDDTWVVSAERLAPNSAPDDLQWQTELARFPDAMRSSLA